MCPVGFVKSFVVVIWEDNVKPFFLLVGGFLVTGIFIGVSTWLINKLLHFLGL